MQRVGVQQKVIRDQPALRTSRLQRAGMVSRRAIRFGFTGSPKRALLIRLDGMLRDVTE